jgi:hypothetical protein
MKSTTTLRLLVGLVVLVAVTTLASVSFAESGSTPSSSRGSTGIPHGVTLRQIDGGLHYFAHLDAKSAWMDTTMLLGGWEEEPLNATDVGYDRKMGNNIYWDAAGSPQQMGCGGPCLVDYNVMRAHGMHICSPNPPDAHTGSETVCAMVGDELDMTTGPSVTAAEKAFDNPPVHGVVVYQGYGKGVLFWYNNAQSRQFVKYSDVLAADSYWMTDSALDIPSQGGCALLPRSARACLNGPGLTTAQRALPANYAYNIMRLERLQSLNGGSKPVVADVETGCPFTSGGGCSTPPAFTAAAWHAIIAGARGIIWFQHNFSGPCYDFYTFYDGSNPHSPMYHCEITRGETLADLVSAVSAVNHEILRLNSVLLAPFAEHYVKVGNADVSFMAKYADGKFYIFAASGRLADVPRHNQYVRFTIAGGYTGPVTVVGEHRVLHAVRGVFTDLFVNADSFHIYEIGKS